MKKDRIIALFAHLGANPEAEVELYQDIGESCGDYDVEQLAGVELRNFFDWGPAPRKPRTWSGRAKINMNGYFWPVASKLPKWVLDGETEVTITEVIK